MSGLSTNVIYTSVCHVVFTLCVYKCQDFQPMWYIPLFVMWFSSYVFINVRTFNQCDIYFCLSCLSTSCLCFVCLSLHHKSLYEQLSLHHQREFFNILLSYLLPNGETNGDSILLPGNSLIILFLKELLPFLTLEKCATPSTFEMELPQNFAYFLITIWNSPKKGL